MDMASNLKFVDPWAKRLNKNLSQHRRKNKTETDQEYLMQN